MGTRVGGRLLGRAQAIVERGTWVTVERGAVGPDASGLGGSALGRGGPA